MKNYPKARRSDLVVSETHDETLVYDLNNNKIYCLNETCRKVWELCDGTLDADAIGARIDRKAKPEFRAEFVNMALSQLQDSGLIESGYSTPRTSRREMMRILGTAGAMALPMVAAAIAPKAVHAQSSCLGTVCVGAPGNCCITGGACCNGGCCAFLGGVCCGSAAGGCCLPGVTCCNGGCCSLPGSTCCGTTPGNCCLPGATCCNGSCCLPGQLCGAAGCCNIGTPGCP